jgi:hypothetical protein
VLQRDPVMLRCLQQHALFRSVMERVNRRLMAGSMDARSRVLASAVAAAIAGAVIHPLAVDLDDATLRAQLRRHVEKMLPSR